jgi:hypothetical protein
VPFLMRPFWFWPLCIALLVALGGASLADQSAKPAPEAYKLQDNSVTQDDLRILQRADQLLSSETLWNHDQDDRVCYDLQETFSLFCALAVACTDVIGKYEHRRVAIQEVRIAIDEVTGGEKLSHPLKDYNNLPTTHFMDIKRVLRIATDRVSARLKP